MTKRFITFISMFFLNLLPVFSLSKGMDLIISFHNKELYYINNPIFLKISLENNSSEIFHFRVADNKVFNLNLLISSLENVPLQSSENFIRDKSDNQPAYFRDISLKPKESFTFLVEIKDFVDIPKSGVYTIKANFFPFLEGVEVSENDPLVSNILVLFVRPEVSEMNKQEDNIREEISKVLQKQDLPPDQIVSYILRARQFDEPEKFFMYLDIEGLMREDSVYRLSYPISEKDRLSLINDYRNFLWKSDTLDLGRKANSFEILNTSYTPFNAKVVARLSFNEGSFISYKDYTFYLRKKDKYWSVYKYTVQGSSIKVKANL